MELENHDEEAKMLSHRSRKAAPVRLRLFDPKNHRD